MTPNGQNGSPVVHRAPSPIPQPADFVSGRVLLERISILEANQARLQLRILEIEAKVDRPMIQVMPPQPPTTTASTSTSTSTSTAPVAPSEPPAPPPTTQPKEAELLPFPPKPALSIVVPDSIDREDKKGRKKQYHRFTHEQREAIIAAHLAAKEKHPKATTAVLGRWVHQYLVRQIGLTQREKSVYDFLRKMGEGANARGSRRTFIGEDGKRHWVQVSKPEQEFK